MATKNRKARRVAELDLSKMSEQDKDLLYGILGRMTNMGPTSLRTEYVGVAQANNKAAAGVGAETCGTAPNPGQEAAKKPSGLLSEARGVQESAHSLAGRLADLVELLTGNTQLCKELPEANSVETMMGSAGSSLERAHDAVSFINKLLFY